MQPVKSQRETSKSSLLIFMLKITIKSLYIKLNKYKDKLNIFLNDKEKYSTYIGNIQNEEFRKQKILEVLDLFSKYLDLIMHVKKLKEVTRNYENIQERIKMFNINIDNNSQVPINHKKNKEKIDMKNDNNKNYTIKEKDSIEDKDKLNPNIIIDNTSKMSSVNENTIINEDLIGDINNSININGK